MKQVLYAIPAVALFSVALVTASAPWSQDPKEAGSTLGQKPAGFHDGAQDPCVKRWDELLGLFDRGETEQIRRLLCDQGSAKGLVNDKTGTDPNDPNRRNPQDPNSTTAPRTTAGQPHADGNSICIANTAVAFLGAGEDNGTKTVSGADAIVARLCEIWPALSDDKEDDAHRSRIVTSLVLEEGQGRKTYLLTIERPETKVNDDKTLFYVSALVCGPDLGNPGRTGVRGNEAPTGRAGETADRTGRAGENSSFTMPNAGTKLMHLHVSMAH